MAAKEGRILQGGRFTLSGISRCVCVSRLVLTTRYLPVLTSFLLTGVIIIAITKLRRVSSTIASHIASRRPHPRAVNILRPSNNLSPTEQDSPHALHNLYLMPQLP